MKNKQEMKKMLIIGYVGAGKYSMCSIIFPNFQQNVQKIGLIRKKPQNQSKFLGTFVLDLWDGEGSLSFPMQKQKFFKGVQVLIYVLDIDDSHIHKFVLKYFQSTLKNIKEFNENANIFVFIHKIDKVPLEQRPQKIEKKQRQIAEIAQRQNVKITKYFATSIWDETLYQAWSNLAQLLIPNQSYIQDTLKSLCDTCFCSEAVLFQRQTFLILSHYQESGYYDIITCEKVANIIKHFKFACKKGGGNIDQMEISTGSFTCFIMEFTRTQNILVVYKKQHRKKQIISLNISNLGKHFQFRKKEQASKELK